MKNYIKMFINRLKHLYSQNSQSFMRFTLLLLALIGIQVNLQANDSDPTVHGTGAKPLTQEQLEDIHQNWPRILAIKPNKIGAARIQEHLQIYGQELFSPLEIALTPDEEFITNKNIDGESVEGLYAQWGIYSLPTSVNNSQLPCFPPIGNQGALGSCVGWATTYYHATHEYGLLNGMNNKASSVGIRSPKWTYNMINFGENLGAYPTDGYNLLNKNGANSIVNFPYDSNFTQWDLNPQNWINALNYRMGPPKFLTINSPSDIEVIKGLLNNGHIITFTTYAYSWVYTQVKADPSTPNNPYAGQRAISWMNGQSGGHHLTIVGYDDNVWIDVNNDGKVDPGEKGAFLVANSWGTSWANQGFIWMSYDAFYKTSQVVNGPGAGRLQIADMLYSVVPLTANYKPKLVATFSLSHNIRHELAMGVGSSSTSTTTPAVTVASHALRRSGGKFAFDGGASRLLTATFALDMTDLIPKTTTTQRYYLLTSDAVPANPATLNSFTLVDLVNNKQVANTALPQNVDNATIRPYIDYQFGNNNLPITVNITSPTNESTVNGTITLTANATGTNLARVDFYSDSTLLTSDTTPPFLVSVDTTKLSNGKHTFTAIAYDTAGNSAQSTINVTVQNATPITNIYINAGGGKVNDMCNSSITWQADTYYTGGNAYVDTSLPTVLGVYRSERWGNFSYTIPVANGNQKVILQFAEIYFRAPGQRVFHVNINGQRVISNLDIYALVGYANPLNYSFPVNVINNTVKVEFVPVVENPKISGIAVVPQ